MNERVSTWTATRGNIVNKNRLNILDLIYNLHPCDLSNCTVLIPDVESDNKGQNVTW